MSTHLGPALVTVALRQLVEAGARAGVPDATVRAGRPDSSPPLGPSVFVYLYAVTLPAVVRDAGLGPVGTVGNLELSYLVAFYGDEDTHEAERMLGSVTAALSAQPVLTASPLAAALAELQANGVAADVPPAELAQARVEVLAQAHDLETLAHIWDLLADAPSTLSVLYRASWLPGASA